MPRFREIAGTQPLAAPCSKVTPAQSATRHWVAPGLAGLVIALAVVAWWWAQHRGTPIAIAVLPLENTSHDPANDYFADGLTDELIRNLSIIDGLTVRSRASSFGLKGKPRNMRDAGQQLQVDYILEGSVLRAGSSCGSMSSWCASTTMFHCGPEGSTGT